MRKLSMSYKFQFGLLPSYCKEAAVPSAVLLLSTGGYVLGFQYALDWWK